MRGPQDRVRFALTCIGLMLLVAVAARMYTDLTRRTYAPRDLPTIQVDVNGASPEELSSLPGIGATLARRIRDERERGGPFRGAQDLARRVPGIGERRLEELRTLIRFSH